MFREGGFKMKVKKLWWIAAIIVISLCIYIGITSHKNESQKQFMYKASLLKPYIVTEENERTLGEAPAGKAGHAVIISVSDGCSRAKSFCGTGNSLGQAWEAAVSLTTKCLKPGALNPLWVRADIVCNSWPASSNTISDELYSTLSGFDFNGLALDSHFKTALPEGMINGMDIYDYKNDILSLDHLNEWLQLNRNEAITEFPDNMTGFECWGWFCDAEGEVFSLYRDGPDNSRRQTGPLDADYVKNIIDSASSFLLQQVNEDGSFIYGIKPQFDEEIDDYNILRHSGTVWSLICRYRLFPDEALKKSIESVIDYMLSQTKVDYDGAAYIYEAKDDEIKIGGNGIAIVALTEYMDVFKDDRYKDACVALGKGILKQQNTQTGGYWHVLYGDLTPKEEFRTVYYDGECTFALARLYSLTGEQEWLNAACKAIDHFIAEDYTQYRDHWVAYSLNEVTKYVERQDYFKFALDNAVNNYVKIEGQAKTFPTNLELLVACFETWQRMIDKGMDTGDFDVQKLLNVISARAHRQLSGFFYPEVVMYMANPQRIEGTFMMRNDGFRVRIDDVQHNIGGFYMYWKNYDTMVAAGLDSTIGDASRDWD